MGQERKIRKMKTNFKPDAKIYSVDELTTYIKNLIEQNKILQNIWVRGEISNFRHSNNTHMYFSLKDENSIIECAMFHRTNQNLGFLPEDGMKIIVRGYIDIYKPKGRYQIIVEEMHLAGKGELYIKFLQLKAKLEKQGFFKEEHKKPLPKYPKTIGVITSSEGSVIRDIIKVVKRRYPHVKLIIFPSLVQGDEAKYTIIKGVETLNQLSVDVIIIARGGGSFEDLWSFNEEIVAKAIYSSKIPIVSAIGHETDFTISDFVADKRAPTPSVAAEMVVPNETEIFNNLANLENRLYRHIRKIIESYKQQIYYITNRPLFKRPFSLIEEYKQLLDEKGTQLKQIAVNKIEILKIELKGYDGKLNALNPYSILKRGYSITMKDGKIVSSIKNINYGDVISTIIKDGEMKSEIQTKNGREII